MRDTRFFPAPDPLRLAEIAELVGARLVRGDPDLVIGGAAPLESAGAGDLSFLENPKYVKHLATTRASACFCQPRYVDRVPADVAVLEADSPYRAYSRYLERAYPAALRPLPAFGESGLSGIVHPDAVLEEGVLVEPGAVVGARAEIGRGTVIASGAVVGEGVAIGRDCSIGPNAVVRHALVGNRVILHSGVAIGQDGFGFAMGAGGHMKVPQVGRVIIQDDVEIGAGTTIDRGANRDTLIGEGTKIDNQVQIGHNVVVGRHCVLVAKVGISGSTVLEDYVVMGGASGAVGHIRIGRGAQIAGASNVKDDVAPGARMAGTPAKPVRDFVREQAAVARLAARPSGGPGEGERG